MQIVLWPGLSQAAVSLSFLASTMESGRPRILVAPKRIKGQVPEWLSTGPGMQQGLPEEELAVLSGAGLRRLPFPPSPAARAVAMPSPVAPGRSNMQSPSPPSYHPAHLTAWQQHPISPVPLKMGLPYPWFLDLDFLCP